MESRCSFENGRSGSGSSRKGKKSNSNKQKQPQRGLGVAQLEKIRLQNEYVSSLNSPFPGDLNTMEYGHIEKRNLTCGEHWPNYTSGRSQLHQGSTSYHMPPTTMTLPLFEQSIEDSAQTKRQHDRSLSLCSFGQNADSNDTQELDLELRLSL